MKKIIKPAEPEKVEYFCDLCGEQIEDSLGLDRVDIITREAYGNGWIGIDRIEQKVFHSHRKCLGTDLDLMKSIEKENNYGENY